MKLLPGGRQELRDFMSVFDADPYLLAIHGVYLNERQYRSLDLCDGHRERAEPR